MGVLGDIGKKVQEIGSEAYRRMKADEPVFGKGIAKFGDTLTNLGTIWDPDGGPAAYSKLKDERELSNALQNESLAKTRKLNAEAAAFEESQVDFGEFFNQVRDGGGGWNNDVVTDLEEATKKLLPDADLNGDKITTRPEWNKALRDGIVPVEKISKVLDIAIADSEPLLNEAQGNVYKLLNELSTSGGREVTRKMFMDNPSLASTSSKHRKAYEAIMRSNQLGNQMNGFHTTKTELANIAKNLEYGQTQNYAINKFLDTPGVKEDIKDAEQWIREIRNSKKTNESGEKFVTVRVEGATSSSTLTEQEVIDGIENKYDVKGGLGQWLRSRLGQVSDDRSLAL